MQDIQKKSDVDLTKFVIEMREKLRTLRFNTTGSHMRDVKQINHTKKELARALTELNSRNSALDE